jgi:hypothetical protein
MQALCYASVMLADQEAMQKRMETMFAAKKYIRIWHFFRPRVDSGRSRSTYCEKSTTRDKWGTIMDTTSTVERVGATKFTAAPDRAIVATMEPFLPPIEQPQELFMKLAYYCTRQQCGTVLTPLQVHSARLPPACGLFSTKVGKLDTKLTLPPETVLLIRAQVARLNVCLFCMDMGPVVHDQSVNACGQMRGTGALPHEPSLYRGRARRTGLCNGVDQRQTRAPAYLCSPVRA